MLLLEYLRYYLHPVRLAQRISGAEWSENWRVWPHCNGQSGCWMHVDGPWCWCRCRWCRLARMIGQGGGEPGRCRHCGDVTEAGDDPAPGLCAMCVKAGRS